MVFKHELFTKGYATFSLAYFLSVLYNMAVTPPIIYHRVLL